MVVLALAVLVLLAAALSFPTSTIPARAPASATHAGGGRDQGRLTHPGKAKGNADLQLYERIARRVAAGESYDKAAVEEQRAANFPVRPALAVRLPTLAYIEAYAGPTGMAILAGLLALATLAAWWLRLGEEPGGMDHRLIALLLLVIGAGIALKGQYLVLHEMWSGMLLALAFALHRPGRWRGAWLAAALALAIRELALPFVLLLAALAWWRGERREFIAWCVLIALFAIGLAIHVMHVDALTSSADRLSPSWFALRGLGGWTSNIVLSSTLYLLPGWIAGPLAVLPLLGWAEWNTDAGRFGFLLFLGYGVFFMIAGRDNNFYWALMVTPAWFIGLAFVPQAVRSLAGSVRRL